MKKVGIIMGSDSDLPRYLRVAIDTLKAFGVVPEVHVYSAHRTPAEALAFARSARENGIGVIIAAAGKAAHLAGALAANTTLPVIGLPVSSHTLDGIDALLSTVQMPSGIPVATVAIDGAVNAALLSIEILAVSDEVLAEKLQKSARPTPPPCFRRTPPWKPGSTGKQLRGAFGERLTEIATALTPHQQSWMENSTRQGARTPGQGRQFKNSSIRHGYAMPPPLKGRLETTQDPRAPLEGKKARSA